MSRLKGRPDEGAGLGSAPRSEQEMEPDDTSMIKLARRELCDSLDRYVSFFFSSS